MNDAVRLFAALLVIVAALLLKVQPGKAATEVDLALVLAVDISGSMDPEEQRLQREGFVEAFRDPEVHDAIGKGMLGRISSSMPSGRATPSSTSWCPGP
jgi:hypothetical protein